MTARERKRIKKMNMLIGYILIGAMTYGPYSAELVRIIDGDTIELRIAVYPQLTKQTKLRLYGIDTPESRTKRLCEKELGMMAKEVTMQWFAKHGTKVTVRNLFLGKFAGRGSRGHHA